ncbi:MAG TPA: hypothetical protein VIF62_07015 [Labilithrix sp.]|jgi:hypothetical protein
MNDLDSIRRRSSIADPDPIPARETLRETPAARARDDVDFPRETPERVAYLANLRAQATTATIAGGDPIKAKQERIDALRKEFAGPYTVNGEVVEAPVMFRMARSTPSNAKEVAKNAAVLDEAARACGTSGDAIRSGQAPAKTVVAVTQWLIDRGHLRSTSDSLPTRIRTMQWRFGVGADCASYTRQAFVRANKCSMQSVGLNPYSESFRGLDSNPHFQKVGITDVRAGDVITLDPAPPESIGHNLIVCDHTLMSDAQKAECVHRYGSSARAFFSGAGPFHAIEVDSSWGAGDLGDTEVGGERRETWFYDEGRKLWGCVGTSKPPTITWSPSQPTAWDSYHGAYRARGT